jgi:DnaJ-class molecular chaperone
MSLSQQTCLYVVLGIDKTADEKAITTAYRKKAFQYHPDQQRNKSPAEIEDASKKMAEVNRAKEVLTDATKRAAYDRGGFEALKTLENGGKPSSEPMVRPGAKLADIIAREGLDTDTSKNPFFKGAAAKPAPAAAKTPEELKAERLAKMMKAGPKNPW